MKLYLLVDVSNSPNVHVEDPRIILQRAVESAAMKKFPGSDIEVEIIAEPPFELSSPELSQQVSPAEAIYGFMGWLTTRKEKLVLSARNDSAPVVAAIDEFCKVNGWDQNLSPDWTSKLTTPDIVKAAEQQKRNLGARLFAPAVPADAEFETDEEESARRANDLPGDSQALPRSENEYVLPEDNTGF